MRSIRFSCVAAALVVILAPLHHSAAQTSAQASTGARVAAASAAPVAYVYVAGPPSKAANNSSVINAFAADANGRLTPVKGSPFPDNVGGMVVNGKYLFGLNINVPYIPRFLIEPNGALHWIQSTKVRTACGGGIGPLTLDHTGSTLYVPTSNATDCLTNVMQSFRVEKSSELTFLGSQQTGYFFGPITFIGNNEYAYGAECTPVNGETVTAIVGLRRLNNGMAGLGPTGKLPETADPEKTYYCPLLTAADTTNHVAVALGLNAFDPFHTFVTGMQIATYTADSSGNLSTKSTYANMPKLATSIVYGLQMSPSGKLLAVCAQNGLQIFHFNGAEPETRYTRLLTKDPVLNCYWDNANHLYAISQQGLYVFTITAEKVTQAPHSPYLIPNAFGLIVQPKTPRPPL